MSIRERLGRLFGLHRPGPSPPGDQSARLALSLADWHRHHQAHIVLDRCRWMGVPALKNPLDAWIYQEILWEVKPAVVVEIGAYRGGSTLFLAHLLDLIGAGEVVSIDRDRARFQPVHPRIKGLEGDSCDPALRAQVFALVAGRSCLVIHDGDHRAAAVLNDLRAYAPLVTPGSYLIVEDGVVDLLPGDPAFGGLGPGPLAAVDAFLQEHPEFAPDPSRERYLLTNNPRGFLCRGRPRT